MTTIQITRPELEALIEERLRSGRFQDVEELIWEALHASPPEPRSGAELVAAMQDSPFRELDIEPPAGMPMPVRDVTL